MMKRDNGGLKSGMGRGWRVNSVMERRASGEGGREGKISLLSIAAYHLLLLSPLAVCFALLFKQSFVFRTAKGSSARGSSTFRLKVASTLKLESQQCDRLLLEMRGPQKLKKLVLLHGGKILSYYTTTA